MCVRFALVVVVVDILICWTGKGLSHFAQRRIFLHGRLAPRLRQMYGRQFRRRRGGRQPMKPLDQNENKKIVRNFQEEKIAQKKNTALLLSFSSSFISHFSLSLSLLFKSSLATPTYKNSLDFFFLHKENLKKKMMF
jgi:hypothetical protein